MGSYQNPIGPVDPYGRYKKEDSDGEPPREKWGLAAYLLHLVKKTVDYFERSPSDKKTLEKEERSVRENLLRFKTILNILKTEDRSQDAPFLNHFSESWNALLEDALRIQRDDSLAGPFKVFIKKIQHYPNDQEHTLGYYLSEYAGQKWIPFPYMELIQKLHAEAERHPDSSTLSEWTQQLDALIQLLQVE